MKLPTLATLVAAMSVIAVAAVHGAAAAPQPHIMTVLMDDVGWYDTQINNPDSDATPHIGELADAGIRLSRHYAFMVCSPTRRSILSGRFPVTLGAGQAGVCDDLLPLPFTLLSEKLNRSGYSCHYVGKGHLGYATMDHLPVNRGFQTHVGYFHADESYSHGTKDFPDYVDQKLQPDGLAHSQARTTDEADGPWDMWHGDHAGIDVVSDIFYSTNYYSDRAISLINQHNKSTPLYIHLPYQVICRSHACCSCAHSHTRIPRVLLTPSPTCPPVHAFLTRYTRLCRELPVLPQPVRRSPRVGAHAAPLYNVESHLCRYASCSRQRLSERDGCLEGSWDVGQPSHHRGIRQWRLHNWQYR